MKTRTLRASLPKSNCRGHRLRESTGGQAIEISEERGYLKVLDGEDRSRHVWEFVICAYLAP